MPHVDNSSVTKNFVVPKGSRSTGRSKIGNQRVSIVKRLQCEALFALPGTAHLSFQNTYDTFA